MDLFTAYWRDTPAAELRVGRELLLKMLGDARASSTLDLVLQARVTRVKKQGDNVVGVDVECLDWPRPSCSTVECAVLIDATEWGDIIPLTGARYRTGNCTSSAIDPTTHFSRSHGPQSSGDTPKAFRPNFAWRCRPLGIKHSWNDFEIRGSRRFARELATLIRPTLVMELVHRLPRHARQRRSLSLWFKYPHAPQLQQ